MKKAFKLSCFFSVLVGSIESKKEEEKSNEGVYPYIGSDRITLVVELYTCQTVSFSFTNLFPGLVFPGDRESYCYFSPNDLVIDWGDGTRSSDDEHTFEKAGIYTIIIYAERLYYFDCSHNHCITSIDLSQSPELERLDFRGNPVKEVIWNA